MHVVQFSLRSPSLFVVSLVSSSVLVLLYSSSRTAFCASSCCLLGSIWYSIQSFSIIGRLRLATNISCFAFMDRASYPATSSCVHPDHPSSYDLFWLPRWRSCPHSWLSVLLSLICLLSSSMLQFLVSWCVVLLGVFCTILVLSLTSFSSLTLSLYHYVPHFISNFWADKGGGRFS